MDYIRAHRKAILAALTGVLVLVVEPATADEIVGVVGVILTWFVPNDQDAKRRIYGK